jgi:hypothetical protein
MTKTAERTKTADYHSHRTRDHKAIRAWAEARNGHPSVVQGSEILRIDFDEKEDKLSPVRWDEFFRVFDSRNLEFLFQDRTQDGKMSRFNKFVRHGGDD